MKICTYYFASSEQIPTAVGAGVLVNPDQSVLAAGGLLFKSCQVLPMKRLTILNNELNQYQLFLNLLSLEKAQRIF